VGTIAHQKKFTDKIGQHICVALLYFILFSFMYFEEL